MKNKSLLVKLSILFSSLFLFASILNNVSNVKNETAIVLADDSLDHRKEEAYADIYYYANPDDYEEPIKTDLSSLIDEYIIKIEFADSIEIINYLIEEYCARVDWILNGIPHDEPVSNLDEIKINALDYISYCLYGSDTYYFFQSEIDLFLNEIRSGIQNAINETEVEDLLNEFEQKMSKYPSNIDLYLVQLKYDLRESFIDYIGRTSLELGAHLPEDSFDWLLECFEDDLKNCNTYEQIMDAYNGSTKSAYNFIRDYRNDGLVSGDKSTKDKNKQTALIVTCVVEGVVILAGCVLGGFLIAKSKKKNIK